MRTARRGPLETLQWRLSAWPPFRKVSYPFWWVKLLTIRAPCQEVGEAVTYLFGLSTILNGSDKRSICSAGWPLTVHTREHMAPPPAGLRGTITACAFLWLAAPVTLPAW